MVGSSLGNMVGALGGSPFFLPKLYGKGELIIRFLTYLYRYSSGCPLTIVMKCLYAQHLWNETKQLISIPNVYHGEMVVECLRLWFYKKELKEFA